jgi:MYXO-CTERM domain-containing protein
MRQPLVLCSPLVAFLVASSAGAADWYVSPTGTATSGCTTRAAPCSLGSAAAGAVAGDNVMLMDGVYKTSLFVTNSGTSTSWITFKADECATPIIEGTGPGPTDDDQSGGVGSTTAEYVRFQGIVARGWNIGFGNGWAGGVDSDEKSNGHWEIENCVSYSNGRTGFTFFSAEGFKLKNSIAAHNGSSSKHSWSSGVTLFEAEGNENIVEGVISFENTDEQQRTDGSGFIVDEESNNATFINNIAFRNSGSCLRLTDSSGTKFINNTCFHNSQFGSRATGPTNPGELYFTNGGVTLEGVLFKNNVIVGTGQSPAGTPVIQNQPMGAAAWSNNHVVTGTVSLFTDPIGMNPNFVPVATATDLIAKGSSGNGAPTTDIGFDPKCLVKRQPVMVGAVARLSHWEFDIDIDYIKSLGGVAKCWNAGTRAATPEIGAYQSGAVTTVAPGACVPPPDNTAGTGGIGPGGMGAGGGSSGGAAGDAAAGGVAGLGGSGAAGAAPTAGTPGTGGAAGAGGSGPSAGAGAGGTTSSAGAGTAGTGIAGSQPSGSGGSATPAGTGGSPAGTTGGSTGSPGGGIGGGSTPPPTTPGSEDSGCGCRVGPEPGPWQSLAGLGLLGGLGALVMRRRRHFR